MQPVRGEHLSSGILLRGKCTRCQKKLAPYSVLVPVFRIPPPTTLQHEGLVMALRLFDGRCLQLAELQPSSFHVLAMVLGDSWGPYIRP